MENREIDKLIASEVLGCVETPSIWFKDYNKEKIYYHVGGSPASEEVSLIEYIDNEWHQYHFAPSTNILDAWEVVEKLKLTVSPTYDGWEVFRSNTSRSERDCKYIGTTNNQTWVKHDSAPMAICLAALESVGIVIEK